MKRIFFILLTTLILSPPSSLAQTPDFASKQAVGMLTEELTLSPLSVEICGGLFCVFWSQNRAPRAPYRRKRVPSLEVSFQSSSS